MPNKKPRRSVDQLSDRLMKKLRRSRKLIAAELPELIEKDQRLFDAMQESTPSGALRRAIHGSQILLPDLADRARTNMHTLDAFLTGDRPLDSDVIDRLAEILKLKLKAKRRQTPATALEGRVKESNTFLQRRCPWPQRQLNMRKVLSSWPNWL